MENKEIQEELIRALHCFGRLNTGQVMEMEGLTQGEFFQLGMPASTWRTILRGMYVWELARYMWVSPPGVPDAAGDGAQGIHRAERGLVRPPQHLHYRHRPGSCRLGADGEAGGAVHGPGDGPDGREDLHSGGFRNRLSDIIEDEIRQRRVAYCKAISLFKRM